FAVTLLQFLWRNLQRAGQGARIGEHVEWVTQIDDDRALAGFELVLQLVGGDAVTLDLANEALPFAPAVKHVGHDSAQEEHEQPAAEQVRIGDYEVELLAENPAQDREADRPQQR